ncbi:MAG TPA: acyl-CoA thioester hydrolase/BAAT C-terminal domain-containing protein [Opitutaceae bacterium]|jgi:dienelactone hydrolase|nr:acyl-CoA thioester hydrolase/BAAT C-terminal domain-containing protein [Opitutaceae bacterium]
MKIYCGLWGLLAVTCGVSPSLKAEPAKNPVAPIPVTGQPFVADFYHTEGSPKKMGILFLGGSEGGISVLGTPRFLATNGYPVLCLAYFKAEGLPDSLEMVPLEYCDKAIAWLEANEAIQPGGIVVVGGSKGAELALLLATRHPDIAGVIAIAPSSVVWQGLPKKFWPAPPARSSWSLLQNPVPFVPYDRSRWFNPFDKLAVYKLYQRSLTQKEAVEKATIEVEKIHGPVLLLSGNEDALWPSAEMGDAICDRLKEKGFSYKYEHVKYKGAGHTLSEYSMLGGTPEGNKQARIESRNKMLEFLQAIEHSSAPAEVNQPGS